MIEDYNPAEFNIQFNIERKTISKATGENVATWNTEYSNVWAKRLAPPRGTENEEAGQEVSLQRDSFKIRNEGRTITAKDHRIEMNGEYFYIIGQRPFKSTLHYLVLDTEKRDNE